MITLKTLNTATEQEVFDQVAEHLLKQNAQSKRATDCAYRGEGGLKCAVGCLIADDEYIPEIENKSWETVVNNYFPDLIDVHADLIINLQKLHDFYEPNSWQRILKKMAEHYELTFNNYETL
jgi:hypothetical protein